MRSTSTPSSATNLLKPVSSSTTVRLRPGAPLTRSNIQNNIPASSSTIHPGLRANTTNKNMDSTLSTNYLNATISSGSSLTSRFRTPTASLSMSSGSGSNATTKNSTSAPTSKALRDQQKNNISGDSILNDHEVLQDYIENDFEGLIDHVKRQIEGQKLPDTVLCFNPAKISQTYSRIPMKVGPDSSGSVRIQREQNIQLYNHHLSIFREASKLYSSAEREITVKSTEIFQHAQKQRTFEDSLLLSQREYDEYKMKVQVITNEINKFEINLIEATRLNQRIETQRNDRIQEYNECSTQVATLGLEITQLRSLLKQKQQLYEHTWNDVDNYTEKVLIVQRQVKDLNAQIEKYLVRKEVPQMQHKLLLLQEQKQILTTQQCSSKNQVDELKFKIQSRETQYEKLFDQHGGQEQQEQMRLLESQVKQLETELIDVTNRVENLQHIADTFETDVPTKKSVLYLEKYDLEELDQEITRFQSKIDEKKKKINQDEIALANIEQQSTQMQSKQQKDELRMNNEIDDWVKNNIREKDRIEFAIAQVEPLFQQKILTLQYEAEETISDMQQQIDALEHTLNVKQQEYKGLQLQLQNVSTEINSLQIQLDRYVELYQLSGPQLERRVVELMNQQAKKRSKISRLRAQVAVYDEDNLLVRQAKLQKVRDRNTTLEQEIVQLGGTALLQRLLPSKPKITPTFDNMTVDDLRLEDYYDPDLESDDDNSSSYHCQTASNCINGINDVVGAGGKRSLMLNTVANSDDISSHLNDTIYEENGEEISATCDENGIGHEEINISSSGFKPRLDASAETQSLIMSQYRQAPPTSTIPSNTRVIKDGLIATQAVPTISSRDRFSTNSSQQVRSPTIPISTTVTGTRPLSRVNTNTSNAAKPTASGLKPIPAPSISKINFPTAPLVSKINTGATVTRPSALSSSSATSRVSTTKLSVQDPKLPSYMRSTQASRRG